MTEPNSTAVDLTAALADISDARDLLADVAIHTPMEDSRWLSAHVGTPVFLKCENLQRTGSFKARGAYVRIARLPAEQRARGVVAASAGNHAQGVALAAQKLGIPATIFMPEGAPIPKERATRSYGAEVVLQGRRVDDCLAAAAEYADRTGAVMIHPFDNPDIVAGQGTVGLEILEQLPEAATVVVPTGGGGLLAGIALAIKATRPDVRIVGVQAEKAAAYPDSLAAGAPVRLGTMPTMADGIAVGLPGEVPFAAVRAHVDEVRTVSEESISQALLTLIEQAKLVAEPAGVAGVAAMMDDPDAFDGPVVAVLSGGNVDPLLLSKVINHGMSSAGRYLLVRVTMPDQPGSLAAMLEVIGRSGGNVVEVIHSRNNPRLELDEVEVAFQIETRSREHAGEVMQALRDQGYACVRG